MAGLSIVGSGCIVTAPEPQEVWEAWRDGLDSPRATLQAFRTSLRGDLLEAEYRCFSGAWKARNGISQVGYREFRETLLDEAPLLRWALVHAEVLSQRDAGPGRAVLELEGAGHRIALLLVQEAYVEVRSEGRRLVSEPVAALGSQLSYDADQGLLFGWVPAPSVETSTIDALVLAREWKIDDIALLDQE